MGMLDLSQFDPRTFAPQGAPDWLRGAQMQAGPAQQGWLMGGGAQAQGMSEDSAAALPAAAQPTMGQIAPPEPSPPKGSLLDHLGAAFHSFAHSKGQGLLGALSNATEGLVTGQRNDPQGYRNQTVAALMKRGMSEDEAAAIISNPEVAKAMIPQIFGKAMDFGQIGEDAFGTKQFGFIDKARARVLDQTGRDLSAGTGEAGGAPGGAVGGGGGLFAPGVRGINSELAGEDYLKQFSPEVQAAVKNRVHGLSTPTGNPRKGFTQTINMLAQKYGEDIGLPSDDTTFSARKKMRDQLSGAAPNSLGGQINIGNTAIGHLADLSEKALALGNWDVLGIPSLSHGVNMARGQISTEQSAKMDALKAAAQHYGQEITKFYAGSPGGEAERNRFLEAVSAAKTPKELAAVLETEAELAHSRVQALDSQIRGTLGEAGAKQYPVVRPETQKAIEKLAENARRLRGVASPAQAAPAAPAAPALKPGVYNWTPQGIQPAQ